MTRASASSSPRSTRGGAGSRGSTPRPDADNARESPRAPLCYNEHVDTTIRNVDESAYRELKARAALSGKTIGELVTAAIRCYLGRPAALTKRGSLRDLMPEAYPKGNERLSEQIDAIVYGV